jgi:putative transposase
MLIRKGFKYRLRPTPEQEAQLSQQAGNTRFIWNRLLEANKKNFEETKKYQFAYEMIMKVPNLRKEFEFLKFSNAQSLQQVGYHLDQAIQHSFSQEVIAERSKRMALAKTDKERAKAYEYGRPKFKKKQLEDSFTIPQHFKVNKNSVQLPKTGKVKWIQHRKWEGTPKSITISRNGKQWFCSVLCEINLPDKVLPSIESCEDNIIGVDVGLKNFAVFSDGTVIKRERHLDKYSKKLSREQRWIDRKVEGSKNRQKQVNKFQITNRKVRNTRKDFLHKVSSDMIAKYSGVILEDLNISGMMKNSKLARSISDVGWYEFSRMLEYKALWNNKHFFKVDQWFASSKICSKCGNKNVHLVLEDRIYVCPVCGNVICRDFNASTNVKVEGIKGLKELFRVNTAIDSQADNGSDCQTTVGHTGSNACGDDKVTEPLNCGSVVVREAGKKKNYLGNLEATGLAPWGVTVPLSSI